ncbi:hypothetical protein cypCar_00043833 [Cyprinus carpio]|nr:hypothetical protein cypCar_00043833 [Cyprinus carpio]
MKGLLLAQTMLSRQATKKWQAQQRCFRESRGKQKRVYTTYLEGDVMEGRQRVRLVSRPMQQNIFWDESEGRLLDVRELLQPSPQLTDQNMGDTMSDKPLIENGIPPEVKDQKCREFALYGSAEVECLSIDGKSGDLSQTTAAEEEEAKGMEKELRDPGV